MADLNHTQDRDSAAAQEYRLRGLGRPLRDGIPHALGENERAIEDYDQDIRLNPEDPFARHYRQIAIGQAGAAGR